MKLPQWNSLSVLLCLLVIINVRSQNGVIGHNKILKLQIDATRKCGYEGCPKTEMDKLNVHIVPHTHDDVGWLKTVDQYYYGSKTSIQKAGVQYILDSVVQQLLKDPQRRFIYVESAFFFKWWKEQTSELQEQVKELVNEGRLEFIGGAWSMNDEATTHYQSIIDQFAWGLKQLNETFGECSRPKIGWQIDPFGHSREMASIFSQMGYDGLFFARLDFEDKLKRMSTKTAELVWHGSPALGLDADIFSGVLYNHYSAPPGFCYDVLCSDEPIIDGNSPENNVEDRVTRFVEYIRKLATHYRTNNVIVPMGDDFHYQDATMWYKNLDKLIKYVNKFAGSEVNIFYSTPSCYVKSLHDADIKWPSKSEDFFPYSSDSKSYWTGYFTSRPTLKGFERIGNHFLQVCKQLTTYKVNQDPIFEMNLASLREVMGIMQHHDAITGTEKQKVAFDYAKQLNDAIEICSRNTRDILNMLSINQYRSNFEFESCLNLNISVCKYTEEVENFIITLYNPLNSLTTQYVRVPVRGDNYEVKDHKGNILPSQIIPIPKPVKNIPDRISDVTNELIFEVKDVPLKGYKSFYISRLINIQRDIIPIFEEINRKGPDLNAENSIKNEHIKIMFDANGFLSNISSNGSSYKVHQEFFYYESEIDSQRSSGAYIFRPHGSAKRITNKVEIEVFRGPLVEEMHQIFNEWVSQVIRIYKNDNHVEFEWLVGPIPVDGQIGKEIITRFDSDIKSDGVFYTDSNGRQMMKRLRDKREAFEPVLEEEISGNYYPITTKIALEDNSFRLAILTDRAQGGSSLKDGQIEVMVHRRLLRDDGFGVSEALNEKVNGHGLLARGKHYFKIGATNSDIKIQERYLQLEKLLSLWSFFSSSKNLNFDEWSQNFTHELTQLNIILPRNVNFMTMEPWKANQILLRFENILEADDDLESNGAITFSVEEIVKKLNGFALRESTLDGNQWIQDMKRLKFKIEDENSDNNGDIYLNSIDGKTRESHGFHDEVDYNITLKPMQIKTFRLSYYWA